MAIHVEFPPRIEEQLRSQWGDLPKATAEALAIESYRQRKISIGFLAEMLAIGVIEAEEWLHTRGVELNYSLADLEADRNALARAFGDQT